MNSNEKLCRVVATILGGAAVAVPRGSLALSPNGDASDGNQLQTVTVTAQRRAENMQDVPITMQALTAETLTQLSATTFDDYVRCLPNVSVASNGPGQGNIFMRGLSAGGTYNQEGGSVGERRRER